MGNNNLPQDPARRRVDRPEIGSFGQWSRLVASDAPGKSSVVDFQSNVSPVPSPVTNLQVKGDSDAATQVCVTLTRPKLIPASLISSADLANPENIPNFLSSSENSNAVKWVSPFADIEWGVGGVNTKARVDILNGLCVNLTASFVRLFVGVEGNFDTGRIFYQLSAFVGPGNSKPGGAQRSIQNATYGGGIGAVQTVPAFAKQFWHCASPADLGTYFFFADRGGTVAMGEFTPTASYPGPFPIPAGAYYYQYTQIAGTPRQTAIFDLAI